MHPHTFVGERKTAAPTPAQGHAKALLQVFDVARDGGSADIEFQLSRSESSAGHNGVEDAQQAQLAVTHIPQQGFPGLSDIRY